MSIPEPEEEPDLEHPEERDDLRQVLLNRCNPSLMETLLIQKMARAGKTQYFYLKKLLAKYCIFTSIDLKNKIHAQVQIMTPGPSIPKSDVYPLS